VLARLRRLRDVLFRAASGASLAATVIRLLRSAAGLSGSRRPVRFDDLDELAGTWSAAEADEFDRVIAEQRTIDHELWA
jgi:hypothetical protein